MLVDLSITSFDPESSPQLAIPIFAGLDKAVWGTCKPVQLKNEVTNESVETFFMVKEKGGVVKMASPGYFDMELDVPIDILDAASSASTNANVGGPY